MAWSVPADFTFGENLTSIRLNQIRSCFAYLEQFEADTDPSGWWSSSGTAPAIGDGTGVLRWRKTGQRLDLAGTIEAGGSTTDGTGDYRFLLPASASVSGVLQHTVRLLSGGVGTNGRPCYGQIVTSTTFELVFDALDGGGVVGASNWGDAIAFAGTIIVDS